LSEPGVSNTVQPYLPKAQMRRGQFWKNEGKGREKRDKKKEMGWR